VLAVLAVLAVLFLRPIPISDWPILLMNFSNTVIFHVFMLFFHLISCIILFLQLYFHGADNWSMNYRHHELIDLN